MRHPVIVDILHNGTTCHRDCPFLNYIGMGSHECTFSKQRGQKSMLHDVEVNDGIRTYDAIGRTPFCIKYVGK